MARKKTQAERFAADAPVIATVQVDLSTGGQRVELIPYDPFNPEKMQAAKVPEGVPQYDSLPDEVGVLKELPALVSEHEYLCDQITALEARKTELKGDIEARLLISSTDKLVVGHYSITRSEPGPRKTLDKDLLLRNGVGAEVIENSYRSTPVKASIRVFDLAAQK